MADPGFHRDLDTIHKSMVMTSSRLAAATANRDNAIAAARKADDDVLTFERHIAMCHKSLNGLLDEWNEAMNSTPEELETKVNA